MRSLRTLGVKQREAQCSVAFSSAHITHLSDCSRAHRARQSETFTSTYVRSHTDTHVHTQVATASFVSLTLPPLFPGSASTFNFHYLSNL